MPMMFVFSENLFLGNWCGLRSANYPIALSLKFTPLQLLLHYCFNVLIQTKSWICFDLGGGSIARCASSDLWSSTTSTLSLLCSSVAVHVEARQRAGYASIH